MHTWHTISMGRWTEVQAVRGAQVDMGCVPRPQSTRGGEGDYEGCARFGQISCST